MLITPDVLLTATSLPGTGCSSSSSVKRSDSGSADAAAAHTIVAVAQAASQLDMICTMRRGAVLIDHVHAANAYNVTATVQWCVHFATLQCALHRGRKSEVELERIFVVDRDEGFKSNCFVTCKAFRLIRKAAVAVSTCQNFEA
jgi:hypothetical protein